MQILKITELLIELHLIIVSRFYSLSITVPKSL